MASNVQENSSDEIVKSSLTSNITCGPCADDGEHLIAVGYCLDCDDFLCSPCFKLHRKARAYKNHKLLDKSNMPTKKQGQKPDNGDEEKCHQHEGEVIHFYCETHSQVGCHACMTIHHQNCSAVKISNMIIGLSEKSEFQDVLSALSKISKQHDGNLQLSKQHIEETNKYHADAISSIMATRAMLDHSQQQTEKQANTMRDTDLKKMKSVSERCETVNDQIRKLTFELESKKGERLFISMVKAKNHIKPFENSLSTLSIDNTIERYVFEPNAVIKKQLYFLGQFPSIPCHRPTSDIELDQFIKCMAITHDGKLVVGTNSNGSPYTELLAVFNPKMLPKIETEISLQSPIFALTVVDKEYIACTFPNELKIKIFRYKSKMLSHHHDIEVTGRCNGIAHHNGTLIVTCLQPSKIEIINLATGNVVKSIPGFDQQVQYPSHVTMSLDGTRFYVSDNNKVLSMTLQGTTEDTVLTCSINGCVVFDNQGLPLVSVDCYNGICRMKDKQLNVLFEGAPSSMVFCKNENILYANASKTIKQYIFK